MHKIDEHLTKHPFRYGVTLIGTLLVIFALNFRKDDLSNTVAEWGQFGDYIGGLLNPVFGLISVVLVAATLRSQTLAAARQAFESQFFNLLNLHESILQSIDRNVSDTVIRKGRDCFFLFYRKIAKISLEENIPMEAAYQRFLAKDGWEVEHYFRTVYHLFKHVKDASNTFHATDDQKKRYYDIIKSQLSQYELVLLWFNVQSANKGNWDSIQNEPLAKPFEHLDKGKLVKNPSSITEQQVLPTASKKEYPFVRTPNRPGWRK